MPLTEEQQKCMDVLRAHYPALYEEMRDVMARIEAILPGGFPFTTTFAGNQPSQEPSQNVPPVVG